MKAWSFHSFVRPGGLLATALMGPVPPGGQAQAFPGEPLLQATGPGQIKHTE